MWNYMVSEIVQALSSPVLLVLFFILDVLIVLLIAFYALREYDGKSEKLDYFHEEEPEEIDVHLMGAQPVEDSLGKSMKNEGLTIVGRKEDETGANTHYKLSDGRTVTRAQGVKMCKQGELPGYQVFKVQGKEYLRSKPNTKKKDNIDKQKKIKKK